MDLFEFVKDALGCMFLSDLCQPRHQSAIRAILETTPEARFSAAQWKKLAEYLICEPIHCAEVSETKQFLMERLNGSVRESE